MAARRNNTAGGSMTTDEKAVAFGRRRRTQRGLAADEMMAILQATGADVSVRMRKPGDWYVECYMGIAHDGVISGKYGQGKSPQEAIEDHWRIYSATTPLRPAVVHTGTGKERHIWWSGRRWRDA